MVASTPLNPGNTSKQSASHSFTVPQSEVHVGVIASIPFAFAITTTPPISGH
jgi:hypothetical protein